MKSRSQTGFSLIELMIALVISLVILAGVGAVFISQWQMNKGTDAQTLIQNSENAISAILTPSIGGAGFAGCANLAQTASIINNPLLLPYNKKPIYGYDAVNTAAGGAVSISADNSANDINTADWSPAIDSSFTSPVGGVVERGSDVLIVMGPVPGIAPIPVTAFNLASTSLTLQLAAVAQLANMNPPLHIGSIGAISDCAQAHVFQISATNGATISFAPNASGSIPGNSATPLFAYLPGAQFIPMQQVAFFVGQGRGGQSSLYMANMINGSWENPPEELIPGVENMQILYGVGSSGVNTQWLPASQVTDWSVVNSVQLAFLLVGGTGANTAGVSQTGGVALTGCSGWSLLGTCVTVPNDTQVRHVYTTIVAVRNASL